MDAEWCSMSEPKVISRDADLRCSGTCRRSSTQWHDPTCENTILHPAASASFGAISTLCDGFGWL
jgi:hypothetical protein